MTLVVVELLNPRVKTQRLTRSHDLRYLTKDTGLHMCTIIPIELSIKPLKESIETLRNQLLKLKSQNNLFDLEQPLVVERCPSCRTIPHVYKPHTCSFPPPYRNQTAFQMQATAQNRSKVKKNMFPFKLI